MLLLEIKNTTSRLTGLDKVQRRMLSDVLSFDVDGAAHAMRAMGRHVQWDGKKRLLQRDGSFPAGLTLEVAKWIKENDLKVEIKDLRVKRSEIKQIPIAMKPGLESRPFQEESCLISDDRPRGIFVIGTGGGKSITACMLVARRKLRTLFVTPDKGLCIQTLAVFRHWLDVEVSDKVKSDAPVVVTNIHQIAKCEEKDLARFQMLIIDEFHHAAALNYLRLNMLAANCYYRYGLTGTLVRPDGRDMVMLGVLSNILLTKTTSDLINDGYLVPPNIHFKRWKLKGQSKLNYRDAYEMITTNWEFNSMVAKLIRERSHGDGLQTLVLVRRIEHGMLLHQLLGEHARFVSGSDSIEEREEVKKNFANKKIRCMIATNIFGEGQDIPSIDCLVNVRLQESEIQTKQGVGRALRLAQGAKSFAESVKLGKSKAEIIDFMIEGNKHLRRHSESRITQYRSEPRFTVTIDD